MFRFTQHDSRSYTWLKLFMPTNVLGTELKCCCRDPMTGFYRDGFCRTGPGDVGLHTICVEVTEDFLDFSVLDGNDLITPRPEWGFPGLKPGDKWCVCVTRWKAALDGGRAARWKCCSCIRADRSGLTKTKASGQFRKVKLCREKICLPGRKSNSRRSLA